MTREEAISMLEQIGRHECIWTFCRHNEVYKTIDIAIEALKEQRPHGEWSSLEYGYKCSVCTAAFYTHSNFCPNCGSDNRGEGDAE